MWYQITAEPDYLRADLFRQETAEHTQEFLAAVAAAVRRYGHSQIFIAVHASKPLFKVGRSGLLDHFKGLGELSRYRIALTGDSDELRLSQQYIESLARQRGINIRAFETNRQSYSRSRTHVGCQTGAEHLSRATDKNDATRIVVASQEKSSRFLADLPLTGSSTAPRNHGSRSRPAS